VRALRRKRPEGEPDKLEALTRASIELAQARGQAFHIGRVQRPGPPGRAEGRALGAPVLSYAGAGSLAACTQEA